MKNIYYIAKVMGSDLRIMKCYPDCIEIFTNMKDCINRATELSSKNEAFPNGSMVFMYTSEPLFGRAHDIRVNKNERYFYRGEEISVFNAKAIIEQL